mmetsp:Transcript_23117/g.91704  ORF Transcript_23117/g.91704 Transcript_23117/m.91704 type:complete len:210 (-) Transcript_23117:1658-2287(-)
MTRGRADATPRRPPHSRPSRRSLPTSRTASASRPSTSPHHHADMARTSATALCRTPVPHSVAAPVGCLRESPILSAFGARSSACTTSSSSPSTTPSSSRAPTCRRRTSRTASIGTCASRTRRSRGGTTRLATPSRPPSTIRVRGCGTSKPSVGPTNQPRRHHMGERLLLLLRDAAPPADGRGLLRTRSGEVAPVVSWKKDDERDPRPRT